MVGPLLTQLLEICTEAHPGWDILSSDRDAELRSFAPATSALPIDGGSGAGGPLGGPPPPHLRRGAGAASVSGFDAEKGVGEYIDSAIRLRQWRWGSNATAWSTSGGRAATWKRGARAEVEPQCGSAELERAQVGHCLSSGWTADLHRWFRGSIRTFLFLRILLTGFQAHARAKRQPSDLCVLAARV